MVPSHSHVHNAMLASTKRVVLLQSMQGKVDKKGGRGQLVGEKIPMVVPFSLILMDTHLSTYMDLRMRC